MPPTDFVDLFEEYRELLACDWAVRVLDAWSKAAERHWACGDEGDDVTGPYWAVFTLQDGYKLLGVGPKPDMARYTAACAVFPTLSAEKQAELGEAPY